MHHGVIQLEFIMGDVESLTLIGSELDLSMAMGNVFNVDISSSEVFCVSSRNWNEVLLFKKYWNLWMLIVIEIQVKLPLAFRNSPWKISILSGFFGIYDHLKSMR